MKVKCIYKFRNNTCKIIGYKIVDTSGNVKNVKAEVLKQLIKDNRIEVVNLSLTSDNRLIDKAEDNSKQGNLRDLADRINFLHKKYVDSMTGEYCNYHNGGRDMQLKVIGNEIDIQLDGYNAKGLDYKIVQKGNEYIFYLNNTVIIKSEDMNNVVNVLMAYTGHYINTDLSVDIQEDIFRDAFIGYLGPVAMAMNSIIYQGKKYDEELGEYSCSLDSYTQFKLLNKYFSSDKLLIKNKHLFRYVFFKKNHKVGDVITFKGVTSTSLDALFTLNRAEERKTVYHILPSSTGIPGIYSSNIMDGMEQEADEVILKAGLRYKVVNRFKIDSTDVYVLQYIGMDPVQDEFIDNQYNKALNEFEFYMLKALYSLIIKQNKYYSMQFRFEDGYDYNNFLDKQIKGSYMLGQDLKLDDNRHLRIFVDVHKNYLDIKVIKDRNTVLKEKKIKCETIDDKVKKIIQVLEIVYK